MTSAEAPAALILVVEDEHLIADDLVRTIRLSGAEVLGPVPTVEQALDRLSRADRLEGAILDINLRGELVWPVADVLQDRNIPFVFLTGYDASIIPPRYGSITRHQKPIEPGPVVDDLLGQAVI